MYSIVKRPMVVGGNIIATSMMYIALTYDHWLIDGREAVLFLRHIKEVMEDPCCLLLDIWRQTPVAAVWLSHSGSQYRLHSSNQNKRKEKFCRFSFLRLTSLPSFPIAGCLSWNGRTLLASIFLFFLWLISLLWMLSYRDLALKSPHLYTISSCFRPGPVKNLMQIAWFCEI